MFHAKAAAGRGSEVSLSRLLEYLVVQGQFGHCPLQPAVLGLQLLQAASLVNPKTTVLGHPAVEGLLRDTDAPGGFNNNTSRGDDPLRLPEFVNDFLGCVLPFGRVSIPRFVWNPNIDPGSTFGGQVTCALLPWTVPSLTLLRDIACRTFCWSRYPATLNWCSGYCCEVSLIPHSWARFTAKLNANQPSPLLNACGFAVWASHMMLNPSLNGSK